VGYVTGAEHARDRAEIFLGRRRYAILNPVGPDLTNVGLVVDRRDVTPPVDPTAVLLDLTRSLGALGARLARARPIQAARCLGPLAQRAVRLTAPGVLLIGDAAGFLDPFTGEGLYAGLRSAALAVEAVLPPLLAGTRLDQALATYDRAWRREFPPKWRVAMGLQQAIRWPALAEALVTLLEHRPALAGRLLAAAGDLIPSRQLTPVRLGVSLTRLLVGGP
jgi:flavin-dependent dehydrogenase